MSAQPASERRGLFAALVAQASAFVLEPVEEVVETQPAKLEPYPVVAVASAAAGSGATTVVRALGAELAARAAGAAIVTRVGPESGRRRAAAPPTRAASRLAAELREAAFATRGCGRLCLAAGEPGPLTAVARYAAPLVLDLPPDGSAAEAARLADRVVIVAASSHEPALAGAVAAVLGRSALTVVTRVVEAGDWEGRADILLPEARVGAYSALLGMRPPGAFGAAVNDLADALAVDEGAFEWNHGISRAGREGWCEP